MPARLAVAVVMLVGCATGSPPDIRGLSDQVVAVGQELVLELDGTDPDGDRLAYSVHTDLVLQNATLTEQPSGAGIFRWTPLAEDVGSHVFDFTASDGSHNTTVSITIDVRAATGSAPVFRQPLGAGTVVDVASMPCMTVDILVEDSDSTQVLIAQEPPLIDGGMLAIVDGTSGTWTWCPTAAQVAAADRYTLVLSADDGDNPKTIKDYVIVLSASTGPSLIVNEIDYDQIGTDTGEYIELYNTAAASVSLAGLRAVLVNGATNAEYATIDLSSVGSLAAHGYLVIAGNSVSVPSSATRIDPLWSQDQVQNGSPDGIALVDDVTHTVLDVLSYEGAITMATISGFPAPISLVEGTALDPGVADSNTVDGTLCRIPDGQDLNDASQDWHFCTQVTPGTMNVP